MKRLVSHRRDLPGGAVMCRAVMLFSSIESFRRRDSAILDHGTSIPNGQNNRSQPCHLGFHQAVEFFIPECVLCTLFYHGR